MAFPDNIFPPDGQCEICGVELTNEVVIQEFADGSIARLCAECAAGAALQPQGDEFRFPDVSAGEVEGDDSSSFDTSASLDDSASFDDSASLEELDAEAVRDGSSPGPASDEPDPMEKTRELLTPVVDLITLQSEMQGALQRLAASLETFATGVISENLDKTATVENRLETLERELEQTRARLRETEALLAAGGAVAAVPEPAADRRATGAFATAAAAGAALAGAAARPDHEREAPAGAATAAGAATLWDFESTADESAESTLPETGEVAQAAEAAQPPEVSGPVAAGDTEPQPYSAADLAAQSTLPPAAPSVALPPVAPPAGPGTAEHHGRPGFQLPEVQAAQRNYNESQFTNRIRDVRRSLGKPKANLTKLIGAEPRALLTITWDIIWYQYLIDLRRDAPSDERVILHREGMDLDELTPIFKEKNASIDDEGRLDASELEVKLLSDPSTLITEMTAEEEQALEDATEEIWDQKTAPEFKWDD